MVITTQAPLSYFNPSWETSRVCCAVRFAEASALMTSLRVRRLTSHHSASLGALCNPWEHSSLLRSLVASKLMGP